MAYPDLISMIETLSLDSGSVSLPAVAGTTLLVDTTKNWEVDKYKDCIVKIIGGTGVGQLALIKHNGASSLQVSPPWVLGLDTNSIYVIYKPEISSELETVLSLVQDSVFGLAALKALLDALNSKLVSLAGGAFYGSYGPRNVEVGNDVDLGIILYEPSGSIITVGEITPGTYTVDRIRGAVDTQVVAATPSSEAAGRVYMAYNFPAASWQVGDIFYITFSGIVVTIGGVATDYPDLFIWGRVVREPDISSKIDTLLADVGYEGLTSLANKITAARAGFLDRINNLTRTQKDTQATTNALAVIGAAIEDTVPFKVSGFLSLHNMQAGDTFLVIEEIRDQDDATYREYGRTSYSDVQTSPIVWFEPKVCQGWRIRIQRTAGIDENVTYQFFKEVKSA